MYFWDWNPPADLNSDYYTCLWGVQVHTFIYVISIIGVVACSLGVLCMCCAESTKERNLFTVIQLAISICLLIGNLKLIWELYVPHMIVMFAYTFFHAIKALLKFVVAIGVCIFGTAYFARFLGKKAIPRDEEAANNEEDGETTATLALVSLGLAAWGFLSLLATFIEAYFLGVVVRDAQYTDLLKNGVNGTFFG